MESIKSNLAKVQKDIEKQNVILRDIQQAKIYRVVEGCHYFKMYKNPKAGVQSFIHILNGKNKDIKNKDAIKAVINSEESTVNFLIDVQDYFEKIQKSIALLLKVKKDKREERSAICIMAPLEDINLPDGYSRRVKNIDELIGEHVLRIYISQKKKMELELPECISYAENYVSVHYDPEQESHCEWIGILAETVGRVYFHSVYQAMDIIARNSNIVKFYDFHGVVPEELSYMGFEEESKKFDAQESILVHNANYIIVANDVMREHIFSKYSNVNAEFIVMPMNNEDNDNVVDDDTIVHKGEAYPIVIYSGGLQKWQLINEMQEAMFERREEFSYRIFVPDQEEFKRSWGDKDYPNKIVIDTKEMEELKKEYVQACYGFVLRDDIIVNRVACPTKILDYMKYGIIPIMKSPFIGDFNKLGIAYITLKDFVSRNLPEESVRIEMCKKNFAILKEMLREYNEGKEKLSHILK